MCIPLDEIIPESRAESHQAELVEVESFQVSKPNEKTISPDYGSNRLYLDLPLSHDCLEEPACLVAQ